MVDFIIKFRWYIIGFFTALGLLFAGMMPVMRTDPDIRNYIPESMNSRVQTDKIESEFGVQDIIMILFEDDSILTEENLLRIKEIDRGIARLKGISRRMSPFTLKSIKGEEGNMVVEKLIGRIPGDSAEMRLLAQSIRENRFAKNIVVSSDMSSAAITAFINTDYPESETLSEVDSVIALHPGKALVIAGGLPYIRRHIMKDVRKDAVVLVPAALFVMLLILKLSLREWKSVMLPFSVVVISTVVSLGMIPLLGWKISLMTLLSPIILIAVANNYGIYLTARYQEISLADQNIPKYDLVKRLTGSLNMPILFSGLTTIAGVLGLLTHAVIAARQVGILASTGIALALIMSLVFIPAVIYMRGKYIPSNPLKKRIDLFHSTPETLAAFIIRDPGGVLTFSVLIIAGISAGILLLRIDTNQENYFPRHHQVRKASEIINKDFGGTQAVSVMIEGDIKDPEIMHGIDSITTQMEKKPGVGSVFSISQVAREMSKAIFDKNEIGYDMIPETREGIAQLFELYYMSGEQDDFSQIINLDNSKAQILIRLANPENIVVRDIIRELESISSTFPAKMITGGYAVIMSDFAALIIKGQVYSLLFALVAVWLLLSMIFRSVKGGFIGSIPLFASILVLFGFMGLTGIAIDAATALLSSIMIGVGVDFTIQYIWCYNSMLRKGSTYTEAVMKAHKTIGRSIIINALSVMAGFSILIFSGFASIRFFGYLVLISIGSCLLGALIIIPAIMIKFRPVFAEKQLKKTTIIK